MSVSITVTKAIKTPTSVTLTPAANPADSCKPVTFTIRINSKPGGSPIGDVTLENEGNILARARLLSGKATVSVTGLHPGTYALTSAYGGDAQNLPSRSGTVQQVVNRGTSCLSRQPVRGPIASVVH